MQITGSILSAILAEIKYLLGGTGTYILNTQLSAEKTYEMPLCILDMPSAIESAQLPGNGLTRMDFSFTLKVYNYEPNAYDSDDAGYSLALLDIIDTIRNFFVNSNWQTNEMQNLATNYGFRMTFSGVANAETLADNENIILGYSLQFETVAYDQTTAASNLETLTDDVTGGTIVGK